VIGSAALRSTTVATPTTVAPASRAAEPITKAGLEYRYAYDLEALGL
jgi:hypothetical protein